LLPVAASHKIAVLSVDAVTTFMPSGDRATPVTIPLCPQRFAVFLDECSKTRSRKTALTVRIQQAMGQVAILLENGFKIGLDNFPRPR
jgi:hypothetical protein